MNRIRPWLYIGNYSETKNESLLNSHSIEAVLQLAEAVKYPAIMSLYLAVEDGEPLSALLLKKGVAFIQENKEAQRTILVACGAGISRSSVFAIAALKEIEKLDLLDAYWQVKERHAETMPHPVLWESLCQYYNEKVAFSRLR